MSPPRTPDDHARKCRAAVLRFVANHPDEKGATIVDSLFGARFSRVDIVRALQGLAANGALVGVGPAGHQRYTLGTPVPDDDSAALAHLQGCGHVGTAILAACTAHRISPTMILAARSREALTRRAVIIAGLDAPLAEIARALRVSVGTVEYYRPTRSEAA
jgi:DNA-binding CsgD family transcriptional regulator